MPIYLYKCSSCESTQEKLQKLSDAPLYQCQNCLTDTLVKQLTAPVFRLKGGGWYETDFKTDKKRNLASASSTDATNTPATTTDSKTKDYKPANTNSSLSTTPAPSPAA